jgi:hypothetical protein
MENTEFYIRFFGVFFLVVIGNVFLLTMSVECGKDKPFIIELLILRFANILCY